MPMAMPMAAYGNADGYVDGYVDAYGDAKLSTWQTPPRGKIADHRENATRACVCVRNQIQSLFTQGQNVS